MVAMPLMVALVVMMMIMNNILVAVLTMITITTGMTNTLVAALTLQQLMNASRQIQPAANIRTLRRRVTAMTKTMVIKRMVLLIFLKTLVDKGSRQILGS